MKLTMKTTVKTMGQALGALAMAAAFVAHAEVAPSIVGGCRPSRQPARLARYRRRQSPGRPAPGKTVSDTSRSGEFSCRSSWPPRMEFV